MIHVFQCIFVEKATSKSTCVMRRACMGREWHPHKKGLKRAVRRGQTLLDEHPILDSTLNDGNHSSSVGNPYMHSSRRGVPPYRPFAATRGIHPPLTSSFDRAPRPAPGVVLSCFARP